MKIHLLDSANKIKIGDAIMANCGAPLTFFGGIEVNTCDPRVCGDCLLRHTISPASWTTYACSDEPVKERCIVPACGRETPYDTTTPIGQREYYVEGAGQLCKDCYERVSL